MKPKFRIGDYIRYGSGSTALMRITYVSIDHAGQGRHRYYGEQCYGGSEGAYESDCSPFSDEDRRTWIEERKLYHIE